MDTREATILEAKRELSRKLRGREDVVAVGLGEGVIHVYVSGTAPEDVASTYRGFPVKFIRSPGFSAQ